MAFTPSDGWRMAVGSQIVGGQDREESGLIKAALSGPLAKTKPNSRPDAAYSPPLIMEKTTNGGGWHGPNHVPKMRN